MLTTHPRGRVLQHGPPARRLCSRLCHAQRWDACPDRGYRL